MVRVCVLRGFCGSGNCVTPDWKATTALAPATARESILVVEYFISGIAWFNTWPVFRW
jgi:hypothetical protein